MTDSTAIEFEDYQNRHEGNPQPEVDHAELDEFMEDEEGSYKDYLRTKLYILQQIQYEEDDVEECVYKMRKHLEKIKKLKEEIDAAFNKFITHGST